GDGTIQNGSKINWANVQNFSTTLATNILTANHSDNRTGSGRSFLHGSLGDANSYEGFNNSMVNGEYFQVNLNGSRLVDQVVLVAASNYSPVSYNVQISTDGGANYNPVTGVSSAIYYPAGDTAGNAGATGYTFNPVDGVTNVRVTNGVVNGGGYWLINEFEVLGTVPEPTSLGLIGLGALALLRRRPRAC
ncbi:MAG TPA: discoidin domain-containing protein, partial [Tepidisphaeraceae bacterium]